MFGLLIVGSNTVSLSKAQCGRPIGRSGMWFVMAVVAKAFVVSRTQNWILHTAQELGLPPRPEVSGCQRPYCWNQSLGIPPCSFLPTEPEARYVAAFAGRYRYAPGPLYVAVYMPIHKVSKFRPISFSLGHTGTLGKAFNCLHVGPIRPSRNAGFHLFPELRYKGKA